MNGSRTPHLVAYLFSDDPGPTTNFVLPFEQSTIFEVPLLIIVLNEGDKSAKNVNVTLTIPDVIYRKEVPRTADKISTARRAERVYDQGENRYVTRVYYHLPDIGPRTSAAVKDLIVASKPTSVNETISARSRDGVPVRATVAVNYAFKVSATVEAEDVAPLKLTSDVSFIKGSVKNLRHIAVNRFKQSNATSTKPPASSETFIAFRQFKTIIRTGSLVVLEAVANSMSRVSVSSH